ncbi:unnamed protein product [Rhizophagus irregularis]|nr:unnamed protein product [Rhizophagus irregularis]
MDEETSLKGLKERRLKVAREYRLKNLKRVADKNLALHKIAKKNTFQAIIFSLSTILFGAIFVFLDGNSGITKIVENAAVGVGSLMTLLTSFKDFMTKTSTDEDCIAIKFSEVSDESVDLSLKTTDEDDIRNTENTIECWCKWLHRMKSFYTTFTLFSSLLLIVFIILNFTSQGKNVISINVAIIIFGGISLILAGTIRYSLSIFTFSGDGGKDIDRLLNGMKIHIKRNTALDLENLLKDLFKPYDMKDDKQEKFDNSELSKTTERLTSLVENDPKKVNEVQDAIAPDIALWIWKLYTAMEELDFILQKNTNSQSELNMKKLMKKLSLKELGTLWGIKGIAKYSRKGKREKNEQPSKKGSDGIDEEFTKITKKLEVIKQIMEKSKKSYTKEFTDFTNNLIGELDGIEESAQVDQLLEEIPKILNCDNLEKYDEKWKKTFYKTSKREDTLKQKDPPNLKDITNLPLIIYEIEKELSKTPKILKEIDQKIETPIEDLGYAKIVNRCSKDKLDDIEKKLFEMHDNIRKDLMNIEKETSQETSKEELKESKELKELLVRLLKELSQISKVLILNEYITLREKNNYTKLHAFIDELSNTLEEFETEMWKKNFLRYIIISKQKKAKKYITFIEEISKNSDNSEIKIKKLYEKIDELKKELSKIHNENHFKTRKAKKIIDEFSKNHDNYPNIEILYEKIDELKKNCQKTSREESKELKELLERLLKELHQISKEFILKEFIKLREDYNYTKLHEWLNEGLSDFTELLNKNDNDMEIDKIEKKLLKVFIDKSYEILNLGKELSNTLGNVKEFNDKISNVYSKKII